MSADPIRHSNVALRARAADASPVLDATKPAERTGEVLLTPGQKIALLKMRGSDWSKAVLSHVVAFGQGDTVGADYYALARLGLAVHKGSYHVLTPTGRRRADQVAVELARAEGMHVITYDLANRYGRAASARCTCGWGTYRTRAVPSYALLIGQDVQRHLEHEGALP